MSLTSFLDTKKLEKLCRQNQVARLGVFGSTARGEASDRSDVDLLVQFSEPKSLLDLVRLEREFSEALGQPVDLLTEAAISPYLHDRIMSEVQVIYEG